ncbi:protein kinase, putative [Bodo saltans]|uniref:Protein kinase, putative n=1 Tax=Bodo saltans TaxID=75058 RepID=A0A0S4JKI4_BODSA|nr:protein kinase, putative [Bodo saltans]|eukprot:CUG92024.1 protein kinase, putative [Bodo saltans]
MAVGNDVEHPVYECRASFLRFHVKCLKDFFRRYETLDARAKADLCDETFYVLNSPSNGDDGKSVLVRHLQQHAAVYANQFCSDAWKKADE